MLLEPAAPAAPPAPRKLGLLPVDLQLLAARFSPCGRFLVGGSFDGRVRRWSVPPFPAPEPESAPVDPKAKKPPVPKDPPLAWTELAPLKGHDGWPSALDFDPTGARVFTGDSWGRLSAWNTADEEPKPLWSVPDAHDGWLREIRVLPDGQRLATTGRDGTLRIRSTTDGALVRSIPLGGDCLALLAHPDGASVFVGDLLGRVLRIDVESGKTLATYDAAVLFVVSRLQDVGGVRCLALSPDRRRLLAGGTTPAGGGTVTGAPTLLAFDVESAKLERRYELGERNDCFLSDATCLPDGTVVAVTNGTPGAGKLLLLKIGADAPSFETTEPANCQSVDLHPDGRRLAVVSTNKGSNGNGRSLAKDGSYPANTSPVYVYELPPAAPAT